MAPGVTVSVHHCTGDPAHLLGGCPRGRVADDGGEEGGVHLGVVEAGDEEEEVLAERLEDGVAHQLRKQVHPPRRRQELAPAEQVEQKLRGTNASIMLLLIKILLSSPCRYVSLNHQPRSHL